MGLTEQPGPGLKFGLCPPALLWALLLPVNAWSELSRTEKGSPEWIWKMPPSCHPPNTALETPLSSPIGISHWPSTTKLFVMLTSETPLLSARSKAYDGPTVLLYSLSLKVSEPSSMLFDQV